VQSYVSPPECRTNSHLLTATKSSENVEEFKYLGATVPNQNCIHEEINSILNFWNARYHSVQNLLSSRLLSKN
jgi:hypothetical protein